MIDIIKLPVKYINIDKDELLRREKEIEKFEEMGIEYKGHTYSPEEVEVGDMYFNVNEIERFNESDEGNVILFLKGGFSIMIYMAIEEFLQLGIFNIK